MKKLIAVTCCILGTMGAKSQQLEKSIFTDIAVAQRNLPRKPTIVYTYVTWCGGNADDIENMHGVLKEYRDKYNLIVLIDSTKQAKTSPLILDLKPEAYVFLNPYYPTSFIKKKEYKQFADDFYLRYRTNQIYMGPATSYLIGCDDKLVKLLNGPDGVNELRVTLLPAVEQCKSE